jgi:hypothetical protein
LHRSVPVDLDPANGNVVRLLGFSRYIVVEVWTPL